MLHKDTPESSVEQTEPSACPCPNDEEYIFFNDPFLALVKASTMFVGEIEFSDIPISLEGNQMIFYLNAKYVIVLIFI